MRKLIGDLSGRVVLWGNRLNEVGRFDGIGLADMRKRGESFRQTLEQSLSLVREHDPRRYARIKRFIHWIVNRASTKGSSGGYDFDIRTCHLEFYDDIPGFAHDALAALYASLLVHESTHGLIASRGIKYRADDRIRIERLCVTEQNRFAARLVALDPERFPERLLIQSFAAGDWGEYWALSPVQRGLSLLSRGLREMARTRRSAEPPLRASEGSPSAGEGGGR
jgi:hypothetical protein